MEFSLAQTAPADIAVIVVNYGTADLAIEAVQSVLDRDHGGRTVDVHLLDNASPGKDASIFTQTHATRAWGERVTLYLEPHNHGFGRGNNVVLAALAKRDVPPKYVFLLNPDAQLENEAVEILASSLDASAEAGFAGAGVCKPDGTAVTAAFRFPNAVNEFSAALSFGPVARALNGWNIALPPDHPSGPVDWVVGAAVMMRWSTLTKIGFFDPAYFLYFEEVDLMYQGNQAGYTCLYVPEARVVHAEGAATGVKSGTRVRKSRPAYWYNSWRIYFRKNHGLVGLMVASLAVLSGSVLGLVLGALRGRSTQLPKDFFADFWTHAIRYAPAQDKAHNG